MFLRVALCLIKPLMIFSLGFAFVYGQSEQLDPAIKDNLERARAAYLKSDFVLAKQLLQQVVAGKRDLAEPHYLLGLIAWREGKIGDAVKAVNESIKHQPHYPEAHYVLGRLYYEKREWKKSEEAAKTAISQGANFANLYVLLGDAVLVQGEHKMAVKHYETALKQPAPNSEVTDDLKERLIAVKNFIEIFAHKDDPNYKRPQHIVDRSIGPPFGAAGRVKIVGVLTEKGEFKPFALASADAVSGRQEELIQTALAYRFRPAMINGKPVLFWLSMAYEKSGVIRR